MSTFSYMYVTLLHISNSIINIILLLIFGTCMHARDPGQPVTAWAVFLMAKGRACMSSVIIILRQCWLGVF